MSILKALQKKQAEETGETAAPVKIPAPADYVPFDKSSRPANVEPELFVKKDVKIGTPSLAFNGQSDSLVGKALPEMETKITAGATLNAVGSPRTAETAPPEFIRWTVEAERVEPRLVAITHPNSNYCEEYRSLRTQILHKSQREKLQSIVVASINPGEGKSVTALNLSWMLAQTDGIKALLIDSDLRLPSLTDYLGIDADRGLSDILSDKATLPESIIKLEPAGLHLLPGGEARNDVAELISGSKFRDILREARDMFDYIIIDAPPLGIFTDATLLINQADAAMLVVRAGKTRYSAIDSILETLPRDRMLGVVLNESEDILDETHYNYGYYNASRRLRT